jgi:hypothetical protein
LQTFSYEESRKLEGKVWRVNRKIQTTFSSSAREMRMKSEEFHDCIDDTLNVYISRYAVYSCSGPVAGSRHPEQETAETPRFIL